MRRAVIGLVAFGSLVSLLVGLVSAQAKKPADAVLTLTEGSVAVGIVVEADGWRLGRSSQSKLRTA